LGEFEELCNENGISLSERVRQLIEHELEQNATTTIGVEYGSKKDEEENTKLLTLGDILYFSLRKNCDNHYDI
jgi:hypothetical protein